MRVIASAVALAVLSAGCSDSPSAPGGTLPVVQNCRIVTGQCKGDTVTVAWDPVEVEVDGYRVWFSPTNPGNWEIVAQVEETVAAHIAPGTGYYCVDAIKGIDSSETQSNKADDRAEMYSADDTLDTQGSNGVRFFSNHLELGDAGDPSFRQDLYVTSEGETILFIRGDYDPENFPGGSYTHIAEAAGTVAPGPGDPAWRSTIAAEPGARYFVSLQGGDYAMFWVDTVYSSLVVLNSCQYQSITGLRLFNPFVF